jgi:hypothetical protein
MELSGIRTEPPEVALALALSLPGRRRAQHVAECLKQEVDWIALESFCRSHQLLSFIYPSLASLGREAVPKIVLNRYQAIYQVNIQRNVRLSAALLEAQELLAGAGIEMAVMRGPALASMVYEDLGLRIFNDLDVLIAPQDFPRCYHALCQAGWRPAFELSVQERSWIVRGDRDFSFSKEQVVLEVHWAVDEKAYAFPLSAGDFLAARRSFSLLGSEASSFTPPYMLMMMCMHGVRHHWGKLVWAVDITWLADQQADLDWQALWEWAGTLRLQRVLAMGLLMAEGIGGAQLPHVLRAACWKDRKARRIVQRILQVRLSSGKEPIGTGYRRARQELSYNLQAREGSKAKIYMLLDRLFTPRQSDWRWVKLPEAWFWLYYALRPLRLVYAASKGFLKHKAK